MQRWRTHPLYCKIRHGAKQLIIPLCIFQLVRTILFPTALDVILLVVMIFVFVSLDLKWL